ncbi:uncharacterized protein LOC109834218 [Asparagus officinalis]|uniref:uncharacterized protein LOC109834218 n=1 Tax=Asparagus officinalis TaxID=4686 RepID=UPI00098E06C7|nr:uncharacterized protein LOC109834218 [Asparagus officinalis]
MDPYVSSPVAHQTPATGRVYTIVPHDHGASGAIVEGIFLVNSVPARILFDSGASHSIISYTFMNRLQLVAHPLDEPLSVSTPLGEVSLLESVCRRCVISLDESEFIIDLFVLRMLDFDIILGMDRLSSYHVSIDCFAKTVSLWASDGSELIIVTSQGNRFVESFLAYIEEVLLRDRGTGLSET